MDAFPCDYCEGPAAFVKTYGVDGVFWFMQGQDGAGSDHLAIWCGACGPKHRSK